MQQALKKNCNVQGCTLKNVRNNNYCQKHIHGDRSAIMTADEQKKIRSHCCSAHCTIGEQHEYGNQYCKECKNGCLWK